MTIRRDIKIAVFGASLGGLSAANVLRQLGFDVQVYELFAKGFEKRGGALGSVDLGLLRTSQMGPYQFPIPSEFSNWRKEQRAWRESIALMDQSFHMTDLYVEGPDVVPFWSGLDLSGGGLFPNA